MAKITKVRRKGGIRQNKKRTERNRFNRTRIKILTRAVREAVGKLNWTNRRGLPPKKGLFEKRPNSGKIPSKFPQMVLQNGGKYPSTTHAHRKI